MIAKRYHARRGGCFAPEVVVLGVETERALVEWTKQPGDGVIRYIAEPVPWGRVFKNRHTHILLLYIIFC